MGHIPKYEELEDLRDEDLIARYNEHAAHTVIGTGFYLDELARRKQERREKHMLVLTKNMRCLTIAITILTIANAVLVAVALFAN